MWLALACEPYSYGLVAGDTGASPAQRLFLVTYALVLVRAPVENAASAGVALEPCSTALELTAALHGAAAVSPSGILGHLFTSIPIAQVRVRGGSH